LPLVLKRVLRFLSFSKTDDGNKCMQMPGPIMNSIIKKYAITVPGIARPIRVRPKKQQLIPQQN
jgi:hypothetical protein